jgi:hypothetical protein
MVLTTDGRKMVSPLAIRLAFERKIGFNLNGNVLHLGAKIMFILTTCRFSQRCLIRCYNTSPGQGEGP